MAVRVNKRAAKLLDGMESRATAAAPRVRVMPSEFDVNRSALAALLVLSSRGDVLMLVRRRDGRTYEVVGYDQREQVITLVPPGKGQAFRFTTRVTPRLDALYEPLWR